MMPRPGPVRIFEGQVIDMRDSNTDSHGRFLPLHDDDPEKFEVVAIATITPGLKEMMRKERCAPCFLRAHEEWDVSRNRVDEITPLVPLGVDDDKWNKFVVGVRAVMEELGIPAGESAQQYLHRKNSDDKFRQIHKNRRPDDSARRELSREYNREEH